MKSHYKHFATTLAATLQLAAIAAVPLAWDARPGAPAPASFDRYHGEALEFRCTFRGFGELPFPSGADIRLWYQTNGMGAAWWSAPATIQSNVLSATWSPALDPGADRVSLFFGAPSNAYASAVLRLRHSPGFAPGTMPDPETFHESDPVFAAWLSTYTPPDTSLEPATNYTDRALGEFAATGTVSRAATYGTPTRWTDATGCVWEASSTWNGDGLPQLVPDGPGSWKSEVEDGWLSYRGNGMWYAGFESLADAFVCEGPEDATTLEMHGEYSDIVLSRSVSTALVARVAYTNDIPEWPAELVHTNTPLIFADGEDTNVTSLALRAQPDNYTSLSFMYPVSYYLPNRFSLLELGHEYQIAAAQWFQVGRYMYLPSTDRLVFCNGGRHRTFQEYLDACSPETISDLLSCYIPTNGGGRIHGDLVIDGRLTAGELITITNSDIHAKGFQVVNKVLTADGITASNGMVRINCARMMIGMGTPRIHLETNSPSAITYGGTWDKPEGNVFSWQERHIEEYLAGNTGGTTIEEINPYMRYNDAMDGFAGWPDKRRNGDVNNGPLKHFNLDNFSTYMFTDSDVGNYGIEFSIKSNAHVRIVYNFASTPPSSVYFSCGNNSGTMLSNGTELLSPTAGAKTLLEIEHLNGSTYMVKETPLTHQNTVMPWVDTQEEEEP